MSSHERHPPNVTIEWSIADMDISTGHSSSSSTLKQHGFTSYLLVVVDSQSDPVVDQHPSEIPKVYNESDSPHYTALLASLAQAKDGLNARLTEWKEIVGDTEKSKEVLPPGTAGQKGMGKAMMMVQAAKQVDGRASSGSRTPTTTMVGTSPRTQVKAPIVGLPTDDQESDEDDDEVDIDAVVG